MCREHSRDNAKPEQKMREGTRREHDGPLPRFLRFEYPVTVLGTDLFERIHARDPDVPTGRDRFDPVLGLTLADGPDLWTESDEELFDLDSESLRGDEVSELVKTDGEQDREDEKEDAERGH